MSLLDNDFINPNTDEINPEIVVPSGRILLKELKVDNKSKGGIILATESDPENTTRIGRVVYNGISVNGFKYHMYREGCIIHFGKHSGATVVYKGEKYISITENEIAAITYQL